MALRRSRDHRIIAGICGGIAEHLGWNPLLVRILWVVLPPGWVLYLILWIVIPPETPGTPV